MEGQKPVHLNKLKHSTGLRLLAPIPQRKHHKVQSINDKWNIAKCYIALSTLTTELQMPGGGLFSYWDKTENHILKENKYKCNTERRAGLVQAVESYCLWPEGSGFKSQSPCIAQAR